MRHDDYSTLIEPTPLLTQLERGGFNERARARGLRFFISRLRSRLIKRLLFRGATLAPLIGAFFAFKSSRTELTRSMAELARVRMRREKSGAVSALVGGAASDSANTGAAVLIGSAVPWLFLLAGSLDGANCALQTMTVGKALLSFMHSQWDVGASIIPPVHWALAQVPSQTSLALALGATVAAVTAELKAEQVAEVHGEESPTAITVASPPTATRAAATVPPQPLPLQ